MDNCAKKAERRGDLTFTLVGQDVTSPETICAWIMLNIKTAPGLKLHEALSKAILMRDLPNRKSAD